MTAKLILTLLKFLAKASLPVAVVVTVKAVLLYLEAGIARFLVPSIHELGFDGTPFAAAIITGFIVWIIGTDIYMLVLIRRVIQAHFPSSVKSMPQ